jgi:hypothetical protein
MKVERSGLREKDWVWRKGTVMKDMEQAQEDGRDVGQEETEEEEGLVLDITLLVEL